MPNHLANLLSENQIVPLLEAEESEEVISELVDILVERKLLEQKDRNRAIDSLQEREQRTSTGIGLGVAIPHAFLDGITDVLAIFGKSEKGIDFSSIDNSPVEFVLLFLVPEDQSQFHLKTLAIVARIFQDEDFRDELREAETTETILKVFEDADH